MRRTRIESGVYTENRNLTVRTIRNVKKIKANRSYRIKQLKSLLPYIRGREFAEGLIERYGRLHSLTDAQWRWVDKLIYVGENAKYQEQVV